MADDRVREAIDIVARELIYLAIEGQYVTWEDFPELGECDWVSVAAKAEEIVGRSRPSNAEYEAAYAYLEQRADPRENV